MVFYPHEPHFFSAHHSVLGLIGWIGGKVPGPEQRSRHTQSEQSGGPTFEAFQFERQAQGF